MDVLGGEKVLKTKEIIKLVNEDVNSPRKRYASVGVRYYEGAHDILNYKLFYFKDGELIEDTMRSNIKIPHPFFRELVDQQVQYMLSGTDSYVKSDIQELQQELDNYFDDEFKAELYDLIENVVVTGSGYLYAYKSSDGAVKFQNANPMGIIEIDARDSDDGEEYIIYYYDDLTKKNNQRIRRIQVWNNREVYYYILEGNKLKIDDTKEINPRPHIIYSKNEDENERFFDEFGFIPFFRLDNNDKQRSNIMAIKPIIDDYDLMSCGLSNNLQDASEYIVVVNGFQGDNLDELIENVKVKKHIGVDNGGGIDFKTVNIPYEARQTKLGLDEINIYRFGMGFNSSLVGDGNVTNVVIKSRYALLDLKCNKLEIRLKKFLKKLIKIVLEEINTKNETNYTVKDVYIDFTREIITNGLDNAQIKQIEANTKAAEINTMLNLAETLGDETVLQNICEILDIDIDEVRKNLPAKEDEMMEVMKDYDGQTNFTASGASL